MEGQISKDVLSKMQVIYANLRDEKSKRIYMDKLLYAVSNDIKYVYQLLEDSFENFGEHLNYLKNKKEVIIYGAGINCEMAVYACKKKNISVNYLCDRDSNKQGNQLWGIEVISPERLINEHKEATILISTTTFYDEVMNYLRKYFSKDNIISFAGKEQMEVIKMQYFDEVIKLKDGEIFVDGGCFDFETSKLLLEQCKVEKIYAFEPDLINLPKVEKQVENMRLKNVDIIPAGMWNCKDILRFQSQGTIKSKLDERGDVEVNVVAVDDVINDKVTFIKMDIEGSELKALQGAKNTIKKYKPNLAICIYHKPEDIIDIPDYLHFLVPEYKFYIRHYSMNSAETVLYAVI